MRCGSKLSEEGGAQAAPQRQRRDGGVEAGEAVLRDRVRTVLPHEDELWGSQGAAPRSLEREDEPNQRTQPECAEECRSDHKMELDEWSEQSSPGAVQSASPPSRLQAFD